MTGVQTCALPISCAGTGNDPVVQFSTLNALAAGHYEGVWRFSEVRRNGDFGIGTLEGLDGETMMVDGKMFHSMADGTVAEVRKKDLIPFATVTHFQPRVTARLRGIGNPEELAAALDEALPKEDCFCAVRVDATMDSVTVRNCPKQSKPYRLLAEVTKEQAVTELHNIPGTLVGFRFPKYIQGLNMNGYHLHFIAKDRKSGGHMLNCKFREATVQADASDKFRLFLIPNEGTR